MARDRQRAKQRKARRAQNPGPTRSEPYRADLPGELEHSSGEVDEFEAALVSGADGQTLDDSEPLEDSEVLEQEAVGEEAVGEEPVGEEGEDEVLDEELEEQAVAAAPAERRDIAPAGAGTPTRRGPARFIAFLKASWAELQRVQWPDRRQVAQATAVVIGFVIVAGLYLGVADWAAKKIVNFII